MWTIKSIEDYVKIEDQIQDFPVIVCPSFVPGDYKLHISTKEKLLETVKDRLQVSPIKEVIILTE